MTSWGRPSWRALLACLLYRALTAALLTAPLTHASTQLMGHHPRGDAVLWAPGAVWLSEWARLLPPRLAASTPLVAAAAVLVAFGWLLPLGALIHSMARPRKRWREGMAVAFAQLPRLAFLQGVTTLVAALLLGLFVGLGAAASQSTHRGTTIAVAAPWLAVALALLFMLPLFVTQDALRVGAIQHPPATAYAWLVGGYRILRNGGLRALWACGWRALLANVAVLGCGAGAWQLSLDGRSALALLPLHAAGLASWLLLRADWLHWLCRRLPPDALRSGVQSATT